jgi:two-component system alkaline phosphatase synthesis response regulator PhoP
MSETEKKKILAVDDDLHTLKLISKILEPEGYEVITAGNGLEALKKAASENPALILLDVMMPELDGFATCAKLKASPATKDIPVILLTAVAEHVKTTKYPIDGVMNAEAEDYLEKPISKDELLRVVSNYASGSH